MKRLYKSLTAWLLCLFFVFSNFIVSFADVKSLMIGSSSNALMTLEIDDSDYLMMSPRSSIVSVSNTVNYADSNVLIRSKRGNSDITHVLSVNSSGEFSYIIPSDYTVNRFDLQLKKGSLPSPGTYRMQFDYSSDFANEISSISIASRRDNSNATSEWDYASVNNFTQNSGDIYFDRIIELGSGLNYIEVRIVLKNTYSAGAGLGGKFSINFSKSSATPDIVTPGVGQGSADYENDVSSSLSDLSSSVDSMTEDLSSAAESLEYISTSQNLIIQGIDNVVMHISDQLFAFWNQLYNLIHVPTMAKMDDIISAIQNMDLEIEVNLDGLKSTINNMSTAVQNKLQSTTDKITVGYDNSGIIQENEKLEQSINQYDEVESGIFEDAEGFIGDFEYPSVDSLPLGIIKALAFVGSFLQGVFLSMGEFSVIITFSLTMIFVMVVVGYHRIRS